MAENRFQKFVDLEADGAPQGNRFAQFVQPGGDLVNPGAMTFEGKGVTDYLKENMDIPGGLSGGLTGARLMAPFGPAASIGGGIVGGAIGSFGGSLSSDALTDQDLDYVKASETALMSAGLDVVTLGGWKAVSPIIKSMRNGGKTPQAAADYILSQARAGSRAGSEESLKASQNFLASKGATLMPFQVSPAGENGLAVLSQRLAETGMFSRQVTEANVSRVNVAVNDALESLITSQHVDPSSIGDTMYSIISQGKKALQYTYGEGLSNVQESLGNKVVSTKPISQYLTKYLSKYEREFGTALNDDVAGLVQKQISNLSEVPSMGANSLIDFEKKLMSTVDELSNPNGVYNGTIDRQTTEAMTGLRDVVTNVLQGADSGAAKQYRALNAAYSESVDKLLPVINKNVIQQTFKGNYEKLGVMLTGGGSSNQLSKFMGSIDESYAQIGRLKGPTNFAPPVATAAEAKDLVRAGYLKKIFPSLGPDFNIKSYRGLADKFNNPKEAAKLKIILGDKYNSTKQLMNIMKEATETSKSDLGSLVLRSKEYAAMGGLAMGVGGGTGAFVLPSLAILFGPVALAKMATNPARVNKLLALKSAKFKNSDALATQLLNSFEDVIGEVLAEQADSDQGQ